MLLLISLYIIASTIFSRSNHEAIPIMQLHDGLSQKQQRIKVSKLRSIWLERFQNKGLKNKLCQLHNFFLQIIEIKLISNGSLHIVTSNPCEMLLVMSNALYLMFVVFFFILTKSASQLPVLV